MEMTLVTLAKMAEEVGYAIKYDVEDEQLKYHDRKEMTDCPHWRYVSLGNFVSRVLGRSLEAKMSAVEREAVAVGTALNLIAEEV